MTINKILRAAAMLLLITCNIGCDQISKSVVRDHIAYHESVQLIENHVVLTKVENSGAFLSLGDDLAPGVKQWVLLVFPALVLLSALFGLFYLKSVSKSTLFALCCVIGGGLGNVFDRIAYGSVTDFLFVQAGFFKTGIFNFADVSITGGVLLLFVEQVYQALKKPG